MAQFAQWLFLTAFILFVLFMIVKTFFYKSVAQKEEKNSAVMKLTLQEAEILIRKHQLQLQRALGEITALRNEVKTLKQRNSQYRVETEKYKSKIKDLEQKIEALL